jgi:hypothetical protein
VEYPPWRDLAKGQKVFSDHDIINAAAHCEGQDWQ